MNHEFSCYDDSPLNDGYKYRDEIPYTELPKLKNQDNATPVKILFVLTPDGILKPKK